MNWLTRMAFWRERGPTCHEIAEVLQAYLDGEVDADTAARVAGHLEACKNCETESQAFQNVITRLKRGELHQPDQRIVAALEQFGRSLIDTDPQIQA